MAKNTKPPNNDNTQKGESLLPELGGLVIPATEKYDMPPVFNQLVKQFCEGAVHERERLAKKLLKMGYSPDTVTIAERTWYDEDNYTMRFECWPVYLGKEREQCN